MKAPLRRTPFRRLGALASLALVLAVSPSGAGSRAFAAPDAGPFTPDATFDQEAPRRAWLSGVAVNGDAVWQWVEVVAFAIASYLAGLVFAWAACALARRVLRYGGGRGGKVFVDAAQRPLRILLASLIFRESVARLHVSTEGSSVIGQLTFALIVFTIAWFALRAVRAGVAWGSAHLRAEPEREIRHRVLRTQLTLLRQMTTGVILAVAVGAVLMQFAFVRNVGLSLLASAGLVGVVVGFAAQKPLASVMAGIQLSVTQPIRVGDTVFVEKELGTIEKIHMTFVVVRLREQRMLVVPVARFLDTPFENWTLAAPDLIGSVLISVDFTAPVDVIRRELARICGEHDGWDQKTCTVEVTNATERTMTLRALVSSSSDAKNWALRCFVRERLIAFLGKLDGGRHLPHDRAAAMNEAEPDVETSGGTSPDERT